MSDGLACGIGFLGWRFWSWGGKSGRQLPAFIQATCYLSDLQSTKTIQELRWSERLTTSDFKFGSTFALQLYVNSMSTCVPMLLNHWNFVPP